MTLRLCLTTLALACSLSTYAVADDVEVLARGPIHEAYAEPSEREPAPTPVIPKEPPKAIEELPPDQKPEGDNVLWLPGYWAWDEDKKDHIWISGFWRNRRRAELGLRVRGEKPRTVGSGLGASGRRPKRTSANGLPAEAAGAARCQRAATPAPSDNHVSFPAVGCGAIATLASGFWSEHRAGWVWVLACIAGRPPATCLSTATGTTRSPSAASLRAGLHSSRSVRGSDLRLYADRDCSRRVSLWRILHAPRIWLLLLRRLLLHRVTPALALLRGAGTSSATVTIGGWHDPLFSYYRCGYRHDRSRAAALRRCTSAVIAAITCGRRRRWSQQNTVINNITNNTTIVNRRRI